MSDKLIDTKKASGRWAIVAVCRECGKKHRTVMSVIDHVLAEHTPLSFEEPK